jgi:hypothetical protein
MIETEELKNLAKEMASLSDSDILYIGSDWFRVCVPRNKAQKEVFPLLFWEKRNADDTEASWDKVVRKCVVKSFHYLNSVVWWHCL